MSETTEPSSERRVSVRVASHQEASCHFATLAKRACRWGKVRDLSRIGISLVVEEHFEPGQFLIVELPSKTTAASAVPARVVYALPQIDGACLVGCSFARPLNEQEYQTLLLAAIAHLRMPPAAPDADGAVVLAGDGEPAIAREAHKVRTGVPTAPADDRCQERVPDHPAGCGVPDPHESVVMTCDDPIARRRP